MRRLTEHPAWCAGLGVLAGALAALVLGAVGLLGPAGPARPRPGAASFLAAWRAHLSASWAVDEMETRTTPGGQLRVPLHEAQRPPDEVRIGIGTASARRGGTLVACATAPAGGHPVCRTSPARVGWAQDVADQLAAIRAVIEGPAAVYDVRGPEGGCWTFTVRDQSRPLPVSLGRGATYCLDARTAALRRSVVTGAGAVTEIDAVAVRAPATDADLALPAGATYETAP